FEDGKGAGLVLDQAAPAFDQTKAGAAGIVDLAHHRPDDRIQAGAIASAGQDADFHAVPSSQESRARSHESAKADSSRHQVAGDEANPLGSLYGSPVHADS